MSLISDALKTAQRERSSQVPSGPAGTPLLEGFFPYVSTSAPDGRSNLARIGVVAIAGLAIVGAAAWFGIPAIRRSLNSRSANSPSLVLPVRAARTPAAPPVQIVQAADTQVARAAVDSTISAGGDAPPTRHATDTKVRSSRASEPKAEVSAVEPTAIRRDTAIAEPSVALASAPDRRPATRPNYEADAVAAFNAGDYTTARSQFELAVRYAPTASAWTNYGVTLEKVGEPQLAARAYRSAMGIDPNYFNAWLYLARVYNLLGDVSQAIPLFNRALEIEPSNSDVNADLAELEYKAGAFTEARRYADVATRANPSNARAQYYLALSADTLKDRIVARQAFEDYLRSMAGNEKDNLPAIGYARVRLQELKGRQ